MPHEPLQQTPRLTRLWEQVAAATQDDDLSHDLAHVARVARWCRRLAPEFGVPLELALAAGFVHDLVNIPKEHPDRPLGSEQSALAGAAMLARAGFDSDEIAAVVEAVRTCSWSRGLAPTSPLGAILQDADRLDAIGAIGLARTFACAQAMHARTRDGQLVHPEDPAGAMDRSLDDKRFAADHLGKKLLKLAEGMHSPTARAEATRRHATLVAFLKALEAEDHSTRT